MAYQDEEYELLSDTETDILITDFPVELIKENLKYQINNPLSTDVNYLETVIDRYRILRETFADNEDARMTLNSNTIDFFTYVISEINDKFELSINIDMFDNVEDCMNAGISLYQFLILRYRKNVTRFIHRFITKNKKMLVEEFDGPRGKDVTSVAIKKKVKNKDDALILSNLPKIINHVMTLDVDTLDFLKYVASDDNYDAGFIRRLVLEGNMLGEFVKDYLNIIIVDYDYILDEIQTEVKTKLMNK